MIAANYDNFLITGKRKAILRHNVSKILKYFRIRNQLSQRDLSIKLGLPKNNIYRLEKAERDLLLDEWIALRLYFNLEEEDLVQGFLSLSHDKFENFGVPPTYSDNNYTKGRLLFLFKKYFIFALGEKYWDGFLDSEGVSPLYFLNINNSLNFNFTMRLFQKLIINNKLNDASKIEEFASLARKLKPHHGNFLIDSEMNFGIRRIENIINNIHVFEENHEYLLEKVDYKNDKVEISFKPKIHLDRSVYLGDPILKNFIEKWIQTYLSVMNGARLNVDILSSYFKGDDRTVLRYSRF